MTFSERTKDVTDSVKKLAYRLLAEKVTIKTFTIAQRLQLMNSGFHDSSEGVRACTKGLLDSWLASLDGQVTKLLECLHVDTSGKTPEVVLNAVLKGKGLFTQVENCCAVFVK